MVVPFRFKKPLHIITEEFSTEVTTEHRLTELGGQDLIRWPGTLVKSHGGAAVHIRKNAQKWEWNGSHGVAFIIVVTYKSPL